MLKIIVITIKGITQCKKPTPIWGNTQQRVNRKRYGS